MCSIAGMRRYGETPILKEQIISLLTSLEHRGTDATGVALVNPDGIHICKDDEIAWKFVTSDMFEEFLDEFLKPETTTALLHTRLATQGSPRKNENNHPLFTGTTALIHNGCISNDDTLFKELGLDREAEVDTDILRAILDAEGLTQEGIRRLELVRGSAAIAAVSTDFPGKLLLARSNNPLVLASSEDMLYWASEKHAIHKASRPWINRFGIDMQETRTQLAWLTMPNDSAWLMGEAGLEWHQQFKLSAWTQYQTTRTYNAHATYDQRKKKWDTLSSHSEGAKEAQTFVECVNCGRWAFSKKEKKDLELDLLKCPKCQLLMREEADDEALSQFCHLM